MMVHDGPAAMDQGESRAGETEEQTPPRERRPAPVEPSNGVSIEGEIPSVPLLPPPGLTLPGALGAASTVGFLREPESEAVESPRASPPSEKRSRLHDPESATATPQVAEIEMEARRSAERCRVLDLGAAVAGLRDATQSSSSSVPPGSISQSSAPTPAELLQGGGAGRVRTQVE